MQGEWKTELVGTCMGRVLVFQEGLWVSLPSLFLLVVVCTKGHQRYRGHAVHAERAGLAAGLNTVPQVDALAMEGMGAGEQLQHLARLVCLKADGTFGVSPNHSGERLWPLFLALPLALVALRASRKKLDASYHGDQDAGDLADRQNQTIVKEV